MKWLERLNQSVDYIEKHLDEKIEPDVAARIACCSTFHFQRMFSYIAGVPLAEYIRRRRMTAAAFDLTSGEKVVDVALKYGYESPTSFNRAFQSVHGVPPSAAQKEGIALKAFPRISFQIVIKGDVEMEYRIEKKEGYRIVGVSVPLSKEVEENFEKVPKLWQKVATDGIIPKLMSMMDSRPQGIMGVSACCGDDRWEYFVAVATTQDTPEGMKEYQVPGATWAVFPGRGPMPDTIQEMEKKIMTEWFPNSGYEYGNAPDIELYLNPDPADSEFEIWVPISKKE